MPRPFGGDQPPVKSAVTEHDLERGAGNGVEVGQDVHGVVALNAREDAGFVAFLRHHGKEFVSVTRFLVGNQANIKARWPSFSGTTVAVAHDSGAEAQG